VRDRIVEAVESNDLDELLRIVDASCTAREWDALVEVRARARAALERGRQLWPASGYAEYRLALDAPAEYAASVLVEDAGRFAPGPLSEVAASTHTWSELAPHVSPGPVAALTAHERVVRGEPVDAGTVSHADVCSVPLRLERWEPEYAVATYRPDRVDAPAPQLPRGRALAPAASAAVVDDPVVTAAARDLVRSWTAGSEGRARVVAVEGGAGAAITALGVPSVHGARLDAGEAVALPAWAGASGGRHGRRRGAAAGRDLAWALLRAVLDVDHDEPLDGRDVERLRFVAWDAPDASTGWVLRLAIEDPVEGLAWAIDARDPAGA
jgi:hypothetical protein